MRLALFGLAFVSADRGKSGDGRSRRCCFSGHGSGIGKDSEIVIKVVCWQTRSERVASCWGLSANSGGGEWV
jgi:hypothetical protein